MNKTALIAILVSGFVLASCGGNSNMIPSNIILPGSSQGYITAPTYLAGTEEYDAFYAINNFRFSVGLGYWNQDVLLDNAAKAHMAYSVANSIGDSKPFQNDLEVQTFNNVQTAGWTGQTPSARAIAQGYYILQNTVTAFNVPTAIAGELYATGPGANVVRDMVNTIYHRAALMSQSTRQIGLARDTSGQTTPATHWWFTHARLDAGQSVASNYISSYPIDQQINVPLSMTPENPSVYSNVANFNFATQTSSPVSVTTAEMVDITATQFTVTVTGSSTPLPGKIWTMNNDPNLNTNNFSQASQDLTTPPKPVPTIPANQVYWVGNAPFLPNTTYTVSFTGTTFLIPYAITNPITLSWKFTTGS